MKLTVAMISLVILVVSAAKADEEASNQAYVTADRDGRCYVKSFPAESYGSQGTTKLYGVSERDDLPPLQTYSWFSREIYLLCMVGHANGSYGSSTIQFGPWARGRRATKDDLALAFYFDGKLVRSYSSLDIAGVPDKVSSSVSHYTVIQVVEGYRRVESNFYVFEVVTADGRHLAFDPTTGEIIDAKSGQK